MLRMNLSARTLTKVPELSLSELAILERSDLQEMVCNSFPDWCAELGFGDLLFVGKEVKPSAEVGDRIDVLALAKNGTSVIFELKRDKDRDQLRQILTYGSLIADWGAEAFLKQLQDSRFAKDQDEAEQIIEDFGIDIEDENFNRTQKLVLVAEAFTWHTLSTVQWLHKEHAVDLFCYKLKAPTVDTANFLSVQRVYPPQGMEEASRKRQSQPGLPQPSLDEVLSKVRNKALSDFVRAEISNGLIPSRRRLFYKVGGTTRFNFNIALEWANIWQINRFRDDLGFWAERLGRDAEVKEVNKGASLTFKLKTAAQLATFKSAVEKEIPPDWFNH